MNGVLLVCLSLLVSAGGSTEFTIDPAVERVSHSAEPMYHSGHPIEGWGNETQFENPVPMVLEEFMIDASMAWVGARDWQWYPSVAFDGTNFLVVWQDDLDGSHYGIYGTRVSQAGTVLDPYGIVICDTIRQQSYPSVAFDGTNYLVVWQDIRGRTDSDIYGARVDPSGTVLDPSGIPISTGVTRERYPSIAFDGTNYLVVWEDGFSILESDVSGARVDPSGMVLDPSGIVISAAPSIQRSPSVSWDGTNYLVVWEDCRNDTSDIYGARVSFAGLLIDSLGIPICTGPNWQHLPSVAFDRSNYLVVWQDYYHGDPDESDIFCTRMSRTGVVLDSPATAICELAGCQRRPAVAFGETDYFVVWEHGDLRGNDLSFVRVDTSGQVALWMDPTEITSAGGWQRSASIAFGGGNQLVVWGDHRGLDGDIYGARLTDWSVLDPSGIAISNAPDYKWYASAAFDGTNYLVVWQDYRSGTDYDIYAARVDQSGVVLDPVGIPISTEIADQMYPRAAFDGTNYLVVWEDARLPHDGYDVNAVFGARVSQSGVVLDQAGIHISPDDHWVFSPSVAFDGSDYLVIWEDWGFDVFGARVTQSGVVLDSSGIDISLDSRGWGPSIAFDGTNYLVVWERQYIWPVYEGTIFGARVSKSGEVLDSTAITISIGDEYRANPSVAFDGTNYLVVWEDNRSGSEYDIYAARVDTSGNVLDSLGIAVCTVAGYQSAPSVTFDGTDHFVVWEDWRDDSLRIFGAKVDTSGTVLDPSGIELINEPYLPASPHVTSGSGNQFLIVYDGVVGYPYNGYRVFGALFPGVGIEEDRSRLHVQRSRVELRQNKPNPFHGHTEIGYSLPSKASVALKVYDSSGRLVNNLVNEERPAGRHTVVWDGKDKSGLKVPSGIYFYRLQAGQSTATSKMILLR